MTDQQYVKEMNDALELIEAARDPEEYARRSNAILGKWMARGDDLGRLLFFACAIGVSIMGELGSLRGKTIEEELELARLRVMHSTDPTP